MILIPIAMLIGMSAWLAWYFLRHDRGEREPVGALWVVFGLGFLGAIAAGFLEAFLIPSQYVSVEHAAPFGVGLFVACLGIGIIEELCKFVPSALYLWNKRFFNEHNDGIIYFAIAGLGFGLPENILYVLQLGAAAGFARVILTPFFHAAMTGLVGYYLARVKLDHKPKIQVVYALGAAALLHGVYDFGLLSGRLLLVVVSLIITLTMAVYLFVLYSRSTRADQQAGLSVVGNNGFCRSCGYPNPKHQLYCQRCGKRA